MEPVSVRLITQNAQSADTLIDADYRDIYAELRKLDLPPAQRPSLRKLVALIGEPPSIAYWSKYEAEPDAVLTRIGKDRLRTAMGMDPLPITIASALSDVDPDAAVWRVGDDAAPHSVILVAAPEPLELHVNHTVEIIAPDTSAAPIKTCDVTRVTPAKTGRNVTMPLSIHLRINDARKAAQMTWAQYLAFLQDLADRDRDASLPACPITRKNTPS